MGGWWRMIKLKLEDEDPEKLIVYIILDIIAMLVYPVLFIWALNILFGLGIEYTIWTYLASVIILLVLVRG